jgi:hypothetical protein
MGLSGVNAHRKQYNFIKFNHCPRCNNKPEDISHFFWKCPSYANIRVELVGTLNAIVQTCDLAYNLKPITKTDLDSTTSFVLYGSEQLSDDNNLIIFIAVQKYIFDSERFS